MAIAGARNGISGASRPPLHQTARRRVHPSRFAIRAPGTSPTSRPRLHHKQPCSLRASAPSIAPEVNATPVITAQVAPTTRKPPKIDPGQLKSVQAEETAVRRAWGRKGRRSSWAAKARAGHHPRHARGQPEEAASRKPGAPQATNAPSALSTQGRPSPRRCAGPETVLRHHLRDAVPRSAVSSMTFPRWRGQVARFSNGCVAVP